MTLLFTICDLICLHLIHLSRKLMSSSIRLHAVHNRCSRGMFKYLPFLIIKLCALVLNLHNALLCSSEHQERYGCNWYDVDISSTTIEKRLRIIFSYLYFDHRCLYSVWSLSSIEFFLPIFVYSWLMIPDMIEILAAQEIFHKFNPLTGHNNEEL